MRILRNILAVIAGATIGSIINMGIIELGPLIISNPEGFDNSTMEKLAETMHLLGPANFITVFLAHGLGTLAGAFVAAKIAASKQQVFAMVMGAWFLIGGIAAVYMFPAPTWYNIVDLALAYIPMAWIGWKLAGGKK